MADTNDIHIVRPAKPKAEPDPADVASEVLAVVFECRAALATFMECVGAFDADLSYRLDGLEIAALRAFAARGKK